MGNDVLEFQILEDGTIKTTTGRISAANHKSADEFMAMLARELGGKAESQKKAATRPLMVHQNHVHR
jgi:hypothetical protein